MALELFQGLPGFSFLSVTGITFSLDQIHFGNREKVQHPIGIRQILEFTDSLVFGIKVKGTANIVFIEQFEQFIPDKFE